MLETTQALSIILMFAVLIQFCVDRVKEVMGERIMSYIKAPIWALGFGVIFALIFQLDAFAMLGLACSYPLVAQLATGLIISAGATPIHELFEKVRQSRINDERFISMGIDITDMNDSSPLNK